MYKKYLILFLITVVIVLILQFFKQYNLISFVVGYYLGLKVYQYFNRIE